MVNAANFGRKYSMNSSAILMLIVIGGIVWGGFIVLLRYAMRREKEKSSVDNS